jgi:hypothetical protein
VGNKFIASFQAGIRQVRYTPSCWRLARRSKSGKPTLGKTMARDDKKTSPAPKSGATEKKEVAAKKDEGRPKDKTAPDADRSKAKSGEKAASSPSDYSRGEGQKPVSKAYRDNWNAIYAKKEKKKRR